jgi:hypothetical protein
MKRFTMNGFLMLMAASLLFTACNKKEPEPAKQEQLQTTRQSSTTPSAAGIRWSVPQRWTEQPPRTMRVATYAIPAAKGDEEAGECAVFYFGKEQGGGINENISRWISQFDKGNTHSMSSKQINGFSVTLVQIAGTYLAPGGPMMQSQGNKENFRLLGAIVEAPEGLVFFKLTGPAKTVAAAETEFEALTASLGK